MWQNAISSFRRPIPRGGSASNGKRKNIDTSDEIIIGTIGEPPGTPSVPEIGARAVPAAAGETPTASTEEAASKKARGPTIADAARSGDLDLLKSILNDDDKDVDEKCLGYTALQLAVFYRHAEIVEYLVAYGAEVNSKDLSGQTPLHWAVERDSPSLVKYLLEAEANADAKDNNGATAMHKAVLKGNATVLRYLVEIGKANLNIKTKDEAGGNAPLHEAAAAGQLEMVQLLLAHKADVNIKNTQGKTPLMRAIAKNREQIVKILLEGGADVSTGDSTGRTALHWAAFYGHEEIVRSLLARRANAHLRDKGGSTPVDIAKHRELPNIIEILTGETAASTDK